MPTIIQSLGGLEDLQPGWLPASSYGTAVALYNDYTADYWTIYRTQPNVRTVVDFLSRNIAQLGLHVFRRISDTDRERLTEHGLARLIGRPNPSTTRYRLIAGLVRDLSIYWNAFWLKIKAQGGGIALLRCPVPYVTVEGGLVPTKYIVSLGGKRLELEPDQVVHFRGEDDVFGLSPLETLRRILAEEDAAGRHRESFWRNAARVAGVIERPREAPEWSDAAAKRFKADFEALYAGQANAGKTPVLEDGMTYKQVAFSPQESEYLAGRKLTREEVARAYHVPLPMVGILDHATFSNIKEQHRHLYQDCLGPWLVMIEEDVELQLLPEFEDTDRVYVEFNIAEKLKGSFEEQAAAISTTVGRPILTANEGRALLNRNALPGDADQLVTPLNVLVGGQASPRDSAPPKALPGGRTFRAEFKAAGDEVDTTYVRLRGRHVEKWEQVLAAFFDRQRSAVLGQLQKARRKAEGDEPPSVDEVFDAERWDAELQGDLYALNTATATAFGERVAEAFEGELDADRMAAWLKENATIAAESINAATRGQVEEALAEEDPAAALRHLFDLARDSRAAQIAQSKVTTAANFGSFEGARQAGAGTKTWRVNSGNPRSQHRALGGVTVGLDENFSNGMAWPGDYRGGSDELAGCQCSLSFGGDR